MKVAILGGDNITNINLVKQTMDEASLPLDDILTTFDEGDDERATGVAYFVRAICKERKIPCRTYSPKWDDLTTPKSEKRKNKNTGKWYNHRAGVDRNQLVVDEAEAFIVIWDGRSAGVADILRRISELKDQKPTFVIKTFV